MGKRQMTTIAFFDKDGNRRYLYPVIGKRTEFSLYPFDCTGDYVIDEKTEKIYRFDPDRNIYRCVGTVAAVNLCE